MEVELSKYSVITEYLDNSKYSVIEGDVCGGRVIQIFCYKEYLEVELSPQYVSVLSKYSVITEYLDKLPTIFCYRRRRLWRYKLNILLSFVEVELTLPPNILSITEYLDNSTSKYSVIEGDVCGGRVI